MKFFGFTRLSAKLLAIFFLILGVTMIGLFAAILVREYFDARRNLVINLQELATTQSTPIAAALWELDDRKITSFLSEVGKLNFIQGAAVTDQSGKIVARYGDIDMPAKSSELVAQEPLVFMHGGNPHALGSIKIIAHDREILRNLKRRLANDAIILFVLLAALTGATVLATNTVIGRPLTLLQESIEKIRRDGVRKRVDWDANDELGQVIRAYNEMQSVHEEAENALRHAHVSLELQKSHDIFQALADNLPNAVAMKDTEYRYLFVNKTFEEWTKTSRRQVVGKTAQDMHWPEFAAKGIMERDRNVLESGKSKTTETTGNWPDGNTRTAIAVRFPIFSSDGTILGVGLINTDIAELKLAEEERLRQYQKMDVLGQLTGSVAHDFNNVLTALDFNLHLLKSQKVDQKQRQGLLENCLDAVKLGSKLSARLTKFARKQPLAETIDDLNALIAGFSDLLGRSVGQGVSIEFLLSDEPLPIKVDAALVEIALLNLALNARDAMPEGGKITISANKTNIDEAIDAFRARDDHRPHALLQVSDTGFGMSPEIREQALKAFFTTKDEGEGTGLGLSTVQDLAQSSGGFVQIESEPGKGTAVKIFLPLCEEEVS